MLKILVLATLAGKVLTQSSTSTASTASGGLPQLPSCAVSEVSLNSGAMLNCTSKHALEKQLHSNQAATASMPNAFVKISTMTILYLVVYFKTAMPQTSEVSIPRTLSNQDSDIYAAALAFNVAVCANVNVAIPDFIGCRNSTSSSSGPLASTTVLGAISVATTAVASFTGGKIFTGSCTTAQFASASLAAGGILEYPWLGCSNQEPGCCPFDIKVGGALSVCPQDYVTTSGACCPSGWSIYSSTIADETPCVTSPSKPLAAPTSNPSSSASVSVITSQQFTLKYTLATKSSSSLPTGAIAGIAVGAAVAIAFFVALLTLFIRKRRSKALIERDAATVKSPTAAGFGPSSEDPNSPMSQMTGPGYPAQTPNRPEPLSWTTEPPTPATPLNPVGGIELPADEAKPIAPPQEMMGDMFIDEHHPAYSPPPQNPPLSPPLSEMHADEATSVHDRKRDTIASMVSEGESPIYSPVGGSALLPDSPHLNGGFVTERVEELEKTGGPAEEHDHTKF